MWKTFQETAAEKGRTEAELDGDLFTSTHSAPPG